MAEIIAIICEYNPFHCGHKYQIDKIRERFPGSTIVAIMSGNITQRASFAMLDKYTRAKAAVSLGVNAVFELPYPFSSSNAEIFASSAVKIATEIGANYLCFGSESGNLDYLSSIADAIDSEIFENEIKDQLNVRSESYISAKEKALSKMGKSLPKSPNDILGVEYVRAIKKYGSKMTPFVIKREGAGYSDLSVQGVMSASAIRNEFYKYATFLSVPDIAKEIYEADISAGAYLDESCALDFLFRFALMQEPEGYKTTFDTPDGCGYFISKIANDCSDSNEFFLRLSSKVWTSSRLKRILMYKLFGVESADESQIFTTLLACDKTGRELVKEAKRKTSLSILTKHSDAKSFDGEMLKNLEISRRSDALYYTFLNKPQRPSDAYRKKTVIL